MPTALTDYPFRIIDLAFSSPLTDVAMELEHLRRLELSGDTPSAVFFQLKDIFHSLESLGSTRFEVDTSMLDDFIASKIENTSLPGDHIQMIGNVERAMAYVDEVMHVDGEITEQMICELHRMSVSGLSHEGDETPGQYRDGAVHVIRPALVSPDVSYVPGLMQELVEFINRPDARKYDLLKMALANHRFCWIHPFYNGNGRVVRLVSYAMMVKHGFKVQTAGRVLNPAAVFCNDRAAYYEKLSGADAGTDDGLEAWCLYVLGGIRDELQKLECLTQYDYLREEILNPALAHSKSAGLVTDQEEAILMMVISRRKFKASDLDDIFGALTPHQRSHQLGKLLDAHMICPVHEGAHLYTINLTNRYLLRGVIHTLEQKGFVPQSVKAMSDVIQRNAPELPYMASRLGGV